jgi:hypothetical protein
VKEFGKPKYRSLKLKALYLAAEDLYNIGALDYETMETIAEAAIERASKTAIKPMKKALNEDPEEVT